MLRTFTAVLPVLLLCAAGLAPAAEEIRLWHGMSGTAGAELDRLVARYNASQKEYRVVSFFRGPYDEVLANDIELRRGTRRAPHIVQVQDAGTADMMRSGFARPFWQIVQGSRPKPRPKSRAQPQPAIEAKYLPAVAAYFSDAEGRLLALPFTAATPVLYYNRDAFRQAGLDPDLPPKTWYEAAKTLGVLVESGQSCGLTAAWQSWVLVENMSAWHNQRFATQGNGMFAGTGNGVAAAAGGPRLAFNTRLMVRWISTLSSWHKAGYFSYSGRRDEAEARFATGECAVLVSSSASYPGLRKRAGFDVGLAQLPYYDDFDDAPQNTLVAGSALWALAGASAAQYRGVASFFAWLAQPQVQVEWQTRTGGVPLTTAAYDLMRKQGFYREHPEQEVAVRQLLAKPTEDSAGIRLGRFRFIRGIIDEELESVWSDKKTPLDALNAAVQRGNLLLENGR
ncbi:MAG TPA: sn-glycerol-3-phosphate ABC transporter substrate-binding protein UgpB [Burkholderiales bacterium]|jgi:sn-glycerol 3-phosphate transport system substrate-binding protein